MKRLENYLLKEKTQIIDSLKKTSQPLSDMEKQKIIQDLQDLNK